MRKVGEIRSKWEGHTAFAQRNSCGLQLAKWYMTPALWLCCGSEPLIGLLLFLMAGVLNNKSCTLDCQQEFPLAFGAKAIF